MATAAKRPRMDKVKKGKTDKHNYYAKAQHDYRKKSYLEPGQRGFLVTCNMREKDCIRDSFRLLNEYADELYGKLGQPAEKPTTSNDDGEQEEEDISVLVQKQAEAIRQEKREYRFNSVETGAKNCCFITTTLQDPKELGLKILRDLAESKKLKSRNILRMMPIEVVTKANLKDIVDGAGGLFDKYFLKEPRTFAIIFNRRFNNSIERETVINELASLVGTKNLGNKANLKNPELAIIVEVIKGLCLISVVPEYFQLRKYNLVEICAKKEDSTEKVGDDAKKFEKEVEKDDDKDTDSKESEEILEVNEEKNGKETLEDNSPENVSSITTEEKKGTSTTTEAKVAPTAEVGKAVSPTDEKAPE